MALTRTVYKFLYVFVLAFVAQKSWASFGQNCPGTTSYYVAPEVASFLDDRTFYITLQNIIGIDDDLIPNACSNTNPTYIDICVKNNLSDNDNTCTLKRITSTPVSLASFAEHPIINAASKTLGTTQVSSFFYGNRVCLVIDTIYGKQPLLCRSASSISTNTDISYGNSTISAGSCAKMFNACSIKESSPYSQAAFNWSGRAMECLTYGLEAIFFDPTFCTPQELKQISPEIPMIGQDIKPFASFYSTMRNYVYGLLILYVIFYGIKMILDYKRVSIQDATMTLFKGLLVLYFSVGITPPTNTSYSSNGTKDFLLPMMTTLTHGLTSMVIENTMTGSLCRFDPNGYDADHKYYAIWDFFDCRIGVYLFLRPLKPIDPDGLPNKLGGVAGLVFVILIFALFGGVMMFSALLVFLVVFTNIIFSTFMSFALGILLLYFFAYLAPIFVPFALFERTKEYFQGWCNLLLGAVLQPVIIISGCAFAIIIMDDALFGTCKFIQNGQDFFVQLPNVDVTRCTQSPGYQLYSAIYDGSMWGKKNFLFWELKYVTFDIYSQILRLAFMSFLIFFFLTKVSELAEYMVGGVSLNVLSLKRFVNEIKSRIASTKK